MYYDQTDFTAISNEVVDLMGAYTSPLIGILGSLFVLIVLRDLIKTWLNV